MSRMSMNLKTSIYSMSSVDIRERCKKIDICECNRENILIRFGRTHNFRYIYSVYKAKILYLLIFDNFYEYYFLKINKIL